MSKLFKYAQKTGSLAKYYNFDYNPGLTDNMNVDGNNSTDECPISTASFAFEQVAAVLTPFQFPEELTSQATNHPLFPILCSGGVIFPYNPTISEGVSMKYDSIELTHTNESYYAWKGTDNVRINISDAVWTCDTFSNAIYALSVLHFFRSYSFMDFGRFKT